MSSIGKAYLVSLFMIGILLTASACESDVDCDETEQCGGGPYGHKSVYREGLCVDTYCVYGEWGPPVCEIDKCGAECDGLHDCENYCEDTVRHYNGHCGWSWSCLCEDYQTEDCSQEDRWYPTGETKWVQDGCLQREQELMEYRRYYCEPNGCDYDVTDEEWWDTGNTSPEEQGVLCGEGRDCPEDQCEGHNAMIYPEDGHDYCNGQGQCIVYSCEPQSYCSDDDPLDGVNGLACGAECDQNSDCDDEDSNTEDVCNSTCQCEHIELGPADQDGDGIIDSEDNCPETYNPEQEDLDGDSIGDVCDNDIDGDGVPNEEDEFPTDPTEWEDTDGDGIGDNSDNCPDTPNPSQTDSDGDGIGDACDTEYCGDSNCDAGENCANCLSDCGCEPNKQCVNGKCITPSKSGSKKTEEETGGGICHDCDVKIHSTTYRESGKAPEEESTEKEPEEEPLRCYMCVGEMLMGKLFLAEECPEGWSEEEKACWDLADTSPPTKSNWQPGSGSTVESLSFIEFDLNEIGACRWSNLQEGYDYMENNCTSYGTHVVCELEAAEGSNDYYIACTDEEGNKDTEETVSYLHYELEKLLEEPPERESPSILTGLVALATPSLLVLIMAVVMVAYLVVYELGKNGKKKPRIRL